MRHSTLRQLEVFEAIARLGSFTRAAEELYLTQPTVSMQIKKLSDAVGLPLLEHVGKKVYLTDAGRAVHAFAREIFDHFSRLEMTIADMKGLKKGTLRLAVVTTAKYFAPRLLGPFCQQHPGIEVSLKVSNRERVLERLAENQDDLYILGQPRRSSTRRRSRSWRTRSSCSRPRTTRWPARRGSRSRAWPRSRS